VPSLFDLAAQLQQFAAGELPRADLDAWLVAALAADPLGVRASDARPWEESPDEERLYWRLVYLYETTDAADEALCALTRRLLDCLAATGSAADTFELLPLVSDQPRLCGIVEKHARGVVSRTGFLNVVANAGYAPHAKVWLAHADAAALAGLCERMTAGAWGEVARMLERAPG
jgi:hypothetical protein